jgi:hypothetical protein
MYIPLIHFPSSSFHDQVSEVPGWEGRGFTYSDDAWSYYETKRILGEIEYLIRPPGITAPTRRGAFFIPFANPWLEDANAFAVFRGTNVGLFKSWYVPVNNITDLFLILSSVKVRLPPIHH